MAKAVRLIPFRIPSSTNEVERIRYGDTSSETSIWRYFTREKFEKFVRQRALWFANLAMLEDQFEGMTPRPARDILQRDVENNLVWLAKLRDRDGNLFNARTLADYADSVATNERNGRELVVVSCWSLNSPENQQMWAKYAPEPDSVVVRSTVGALANALLTPSSGYRWRVGQVRYSDHGGDGMSAYEGNQALERAFLKGMEFAWEREVRFATDNFVSWGRLNPDGSSPTERQRQGYAYETRRRGVLIPVPFRGVIQDVFPAPNSKRVHQDLALRLMADAGLKVDVKETVLPWYHGGR